MRVAVIISMMMVLVSCATKLPEQTKVEYSYRFGLLDDIDADVWTMSKPADTVYWKRGVSEPYYGVDISRDGNSPFLAFSTYGVETMMVLES